MVSTCSENEFQCAGGECIAGYKKCNGYRDCVNGDDEADCQDNPAEGKIIILQKSLLFLSFKFPTKICIYYKKNVNYV